MTLSDEELLISQPPPQFQQEKLPVRIASSQPIHIQCQAEERHFVNSLPMKVTGSLKPIRFASDTQARPGQYRSEIVVHNNPAMDLYIKRLRVAFNTYGDSAMNVSKNERSPGRSRSAHAASQKSQRQQQGKYRSISVPRPNSQAILHQWIDDICSNEKLMTDDDICFFLKNGEFLARI